MNFRWTASFSVALLLPALASANALDHLRTTDDIGLNKVPHSGTSHVLVIPSRVGQAFPAGELATLRSYFAPEGGPGTFRHYWQTASNGAYDPIPTVVDPVDYLDRCPIPGKTLNTCSFALDDIALLTSRGLATTFQDVLSRVRDEQGIDLGTFDVNSATGASPDGYFDGVIVSSDMYSGIGFPLAAVDNTATVRALTDPDGGVDDAGVGGQGAVLQAGIVAMIPPDTHEFGHILGFIDLYGGPTTNDLMMDISSTLSAFSLQQIGWADVQTVTAEGEINLAPTLSGGSVLKFGSAPRYVMVENRGGTNHELYDTSHPGIYVYTVDEDTLPQTPLGFVDIFAGVLYLPNQAPPYLNVNLPVGCSVGTSLAPGTCALAAENEERVLVHASGAATGFGIRRGATQADGTITLTVFAAGPPDAGVTPPPDAGVTPMPDAGAVQVTDAGTSATSADGGNAAAASGCPGCSNSAPGVDWLAFMVLLALLRPRRV